ncbi:MAG: ABC transporter substrate-binding protein, partial [Deltaproteobacteria bacterium]|nr:ABC transporter substrate-binding protein [Deltaproteobacteria bacterium]
MKNAFIKNHSRKLTEGHIDRRQFITSALAVGVTLPTALSLANSAEAATPKKGGKLRLGYGYGSTTDSLDPGTSENGMTQGIHKCYGNLLFDTENTGELAGDLVESYEGSNGAKTWVLDLRRGVEFHNGKTLDADDVIATINYHRGEASKSAAKGLLTSISDIRKGSRNQVIFDLSSGNGDFPYLLSDYHLVIMQAKGGKVDPLAGMGTGPYVLKSFEPGVKGTFVKNKNYWRSDRGHFDEVEIMTILDTTARQNAVMNGEVDAINEVDPKIVNLMRRNPGIEILQATGTKHYTFPMRLDTEPFGNYDLRMALKLSVKRQ